MEQVIDVLQTVKLLRTKRPGIVEDLVSFVSYVIMPICIAIPYTYTFSYLAGYIASYNSLSYCYTVCFSFIQDQYQFVFTVVARFLQSFDTYDNFKI